MLLCWKQTGNIVEYRMIFGNYFKQKNVNWKKRRKPLWNILVIVKTHAKRLDLEKHNNLVVNWVYGGAYL